MPELQVTLLGWKQAPSSAAAAPSAEKRGKTREARRDAERPE